MADKASPRRMFNGPPLVALRQRVNEMPRNIKRVVLVIADATALLAILWLSYSLRLGIWFVPSLAQALLMLAAPAVAVPIFARLGLYRAVIRYLPERAIWTVLQAMSFATLVWVGILFLAEVSRFGTVPRSIPVFYWLLGTVVIAGSRFLAKAWLWSPLRDAYRPGAVVIYGADRAGSQLAIALRDVDSRYVTAFIDDDPALQGRDVAGVRVYPRERLDGLIRNDGVREIILSTPSLDARRRREIVGELSRHAVKIRALPAISDLASGKYLVGQLREIDIDDLLGRSSVAPNPALFERMLADRVILVTGAGGSIGSELCRLIVKWAPRRLVLLDANEYALYQIERSLGARSDVPLVPVLGSVTDRRLVRRVLREQGVDVVFHAAAHKHVPLVEANALEGVRNNVIGTSVLAEAARDAGVADFVLISSDKAVRPTNVMGATKRWAEIIVQALAGGGGQTRFSVVRFGNVLGSTGSVVPLFREQIAAGGPVTLTEEAMTRYFMSIHEAAELIVQAGALAEGGDIFLLEMGEPVRIRDLAENMIRLAGLSVRSDDNPAGDIEIALIGRRPGEKLHEELFYDPGRAQPTSQPKILRAGARVRPRDTLADAMARLDAALEAEDEPLLRDVLFGYVAGTGPQAGLAEAGDADTGLADGGRGDAGDADASRGEAGDEPALRQPARP